MLVDSGLHPPVQEKLINFSRPHLFWAVILFLFLVIFVEKPVHIDDTVFLETARHLMERPFDPFGVQVNWDKGNQSIFFEDNPFFLSYFFTLVMKIFGDSEWILHSACMLFAFASFFAFIGISGLTGREAWIAGGLLASSPAFLVSATTLMADVPLLAFYLLACLCYLRFRETGKPVFGWGLSVFIILAGFTKYIGLSLIPLFLLDSILRKSFTKTILYLTVPVLALFVWCFHNVATFGAIHVLDAGRSMAFAPADVFRKVIASFSFAGLSIILFGIVGLLNNRFFVVAWILLALLSFLLIRSFHLATHGWNAGLMGLGIASAIIGFYRAMQEKDRLLLIWFAGMLVYSWLSEFIAARVVLLFAPPLILLLTPKMKKRTGLAAIALNFAFSFWITAEDTHLARMYKQVAESMPVQNTHYIGHWGLQYYLEKRGLQPFDYRTDTLQKDDRIIVPVVAGASFYPMPVKDGMFRNAEVRLDMETRLQAHHGMFVMSKSNDAGLYCHGWGMLPFGFGSGPLETLRYFRVVDVH